MHQILSLHVKKMTYFDRHLTNACGRRFMNELFWCK